MARHRAHAALSWLFPSAMLVLCLILGVLQYRWIDEASRAERDRLRGSLQAALNRLAIAFNSDLTSAVSAFLPRHPPRDEANIEDDYLALYSQWLESTPHERLFSSIALVTARGGQLHLQILDQDSASFRSSAWPEPWRPLKHRMEARLAQMLEARSGREPREFRPMRPAPGAGDDGFLIEIPARGRGPVDPSRATWLIFELDPSYIRGTLLPDLLRRYLGASLSDYQVEVVTRGDAPQPVFRAGGGAVRPPADASAALFEIQYDQIFRRMGPPGLREAARARSTPGEFGRWQISVRHHAGSLDAVVARTRFRNLAVTAAILILMLATLAALVRYTRRAQRLAALQFDFVTGVSHELRTPLTVIRTASFNLRGKLARDPALVEKYSALIQKESERLTEIVEQVLRFASTSAAGRRRTRSPVWLPAVVEEAVAASRPLIPPSCALEIDVPPALPPVLAEPVGLRHALQNLLANAAKYGAPGGWIGLSASLSGPGHVEIRVSDRGPGIPPEELPYVFDPFFRGRRAIDDQVHGTGLGLALVRNIVESCGGDVLVSSRPGELTQFVLRLPAAPASEAAAPSPAPQGVSG